MKTCKICKRRFDPIQPLQVTCGLQCALTHGRKKAHVKKREELRARKAKLMTLSDHHKATQAIFNKYIRLRDRGEPCISCQKATGAKINAGHYLARGSHPELRYSEDNCHLQCEKCNSWLSGNQQQYRIHLINKIGLDKVLELEGDHPAKQYRVTDLIELRGIYRDKIKELSR